MHWYITVLKKYAVFSGRARRKEFWSFALTHFIFYMLLSGIDRLIGNALELETPMPILSSIYSLAVLIPSLAVSVRRLHDIGKSGWWLLLSLIPCLGSLILLIFFLQNSQPGTNEYGPNPKEA